MDQNLRKICRLDEAGRAGIVARRRDGPMIAGILIPLGHKDSLSLGGELLLFEWKPRSFIPVVVVAIVATVLRVPLLGAGPILPVAPHAPLAGLELAIAARLGILAGFGSSWLTRLVYACEDLFQRLPVHWTRWPAIGAVFIGVGGWLETRVLGVGYDSNQSLHLWPGGMHNGRARVATFEALFPGSTRIKPARRRRVDSCLLVAPPLCHQLASPKFKISEAES